MLRIGIDAHVLTGKPQGSRTWLVNIIGRAAARHPDATYVVYSTDPVACARIVSGSNIEHQRLPRVPALQRRWDRAVQDHRHRRPARFRAG